MNGQFSQNVWELAVSIPPGRVTTYGILARAAGGTGQAARSVSRILSKAPNQSAIPWHRIVYANGRVWLSNNNEKQRRNLYQTEEIEVDQKGQITNFTELVYYFD